MNNIESRTDFLGKKPIDELREQGIDIPREYHNLVNNNYDSLKEKILKSFEEKYTYRFYEHFSNYLKYHYRGYLDRDLYNLAKKFKYDDIICDLFNKSIGEEEYLEKYPEFLNEFFNNTEDMQLKNFTSSDYGRRSLYKLEQDTFASQILEDMICKHSNGALVPNKNRSGNKGIFDVNTHSDLKCIIDFNNEKIEVPIELKTQITKNVEKLKLKVRGNGDTVLAEGGMYLYISLNHDLVYIHDTVTYGFNQFITEERDGKTWRILDLSIETDKNVDKYTYNLGKMKNLCFWYYKENDENKEANDMKAILNGIYTMYKNRNKKA